MRSVNVYIKIHITFFASVSFYSLLETVHTVVSNEHAVPTGSFGSISHCMESFYGLLCAPLPPKTNGDVAWLVAIRAPCVSTNSCAHITAAVAVVNVSCGCICTLHISQHLVVCDDPIWVEIAYCVSYFIMACINYVHFLATVGISYFKFLLGGYCAEYALLCM